MVDKKLLTKLVKKLWLIFSVATQILCKHHPSYNKIL